MTTSQVTEGREETRRRGGVSRNLLLGGRVRTGARSPREDCPIRQRQGLHAQLHGLLGRVSTSLACRWDPEKENHGKGWKDCRRFFTADIKWVLAVGGPGYWPQWYRHRVVVLVAKFWKGKAYEVVEL